MQFLLSGTNNGITTAKLGSRKVNAINEKVIDELRGLFEKLAADKETKAVILTGTGKFFTFGFDIPEFIKYPREGFFRYLTKFTDFYNCLYNNPTKNKIYRTLSDVSCAFRHLLTPACNA